MPGRCPQDGGFIGQSGCTHPNHNHSELVTQLLAAAKDPRPMDAATAELALKEGFYVGTRTAGVRIGFGEKLLAHTDDHSARKAEERKVLLQYAIKTARAGNRKPNAKGGPGSWSYAMSFDDFGMLVCTDRNGDVEDTFTFFPDEKKARGRRK